MGHLFAQIDIQGLRAPGRACHDQLPRREWRSWEEVGNMRKKKRKACVKTRRNIRQYQKGNHSLPLAFAVSDIYLFSQTNIKHHH